MNIIEFRMIDMLKSLKEDFGAISVRAEFEAEGTKLEELLRLKEISMKAGLGLTLKIGGCESLRDMLEARTVGVNYLVAPMIESSYALKKYLMAVNNIFPLEERRKIEILCNIETIDAVNCFDDILKVPELDILNGIVIERVDLCYSMGNTDDCVNNEEINAIVESTVKKAKAKNLSCTLGGALSVSSLPFIRHISGKFLDRIETRKICFNSNKILKHKNPEKGVFKALGFEMLWLRNKLNFYRSIATADKQRMVMIEHKYMKELDIIL